MMVPADLRAQEEERICRRVAAGDHIEHYDTVRVTKSGRKIDVSLTISPLRDASGQIIGASKTARDISDRKLLEKIREQSRAELESLVEERTATLRSLSNRLMHMQDDEQRRIARELHDSVGQYLAALKMNLAQLEQSDTQKTKTALSESRQLLDQCISEIRTISHVLHPLLLDECGLASAAKWYIEGFGKRSNIQVKFEISERIVRLPDAVELALFRALQESLTKVHRHSASPKVDVHFGIEDSRVSLIVRDYGQGISHDRLEDFKKAASHLGVGLTGIRERLNELGGHLQVLAEKPGTSIKITILSSAHSSVGDRAGIIVRIFIVVSSLCTTSPCAACRISS
jgi:two-component system sensor histidine kinase UhpB